MPTDGLVGACVRLILGAFEASHARFKDITSRARIRFEKRDWAGTQQDAAERLDLWQGAVDLTVTHCRKDLGARPADQDLWMAIKGAYSGSIAPLPEAELAETFYNSVVRRVRATVGIDPRFEYLDAEAAPAPRPANAFLKRHFNPGRTEDLVKAILRDCGVRARFEDLDRDARLAAEQIEAHLGSLPDAPAVESVEVVDSAFYRNKGAYVIGRVRAGRHALPLILPLLHQERGVVLDAVLLTAEEASIVFSFARSYFRVEVDSPRDLIDFLKSLMPLKPVAELYNSIGYHKHGKRVFYRDLVRHLANSRDQFVTAPGIEGMVMIVFALPSYEVVFKVIRDVFDHPKRTTRQQVRDRYRLVFRHDRAGRLIDAQEFEHLEFERARFSPAVLQALAAGAAENVILGADRVVIRHLYVERKVEPLNLYLEKAAPEDAAEAVLDYGTAIKDLAAAGIFPGDLLVKNFGVTRHGRVVFYDYDELSLLADCSVREIPKSDNPDDELDGEPWFYAADNDFFPEEFPSFLGLHGRLRELFIRQHGDLFGVDYWRQMQARLAQGDVADIFPYRHCRRLRAGDPGA